MFVTRKLSILQTYLELGRTSAINGSLEKTVLSFKGLTHQSFSIAVVTTDCERQREKAFNSAFMINKRFPMLPLGTLMAVCNEDGSFKMMQCHEGYCWCVDGQGNKVAERTKRFEKPECERCEYYKDFVNILIVSPLVFDTRLFLFINQKQ